LARGRAQKADYLLNMARGEALKAITISELQAISDASNMQLRAERDSDDSVLNGQKTHTTLADGSDFILTYAVTDPDAEPRHWGIISSSKSREGRSTARASLTTPSTISGTTAGRRGR
jgi:alkylation response protein AidB-like acyl-CoA dehydrogenase